MDDNDQTPVRHETTIVDARERGGGGTIIAVILVLLLAIAAFLYFGGYLTRAAEKADININIDTGGGSASGSQGK